MDVKVLGNKYALDSRWAAIQDANCNILMLCVHFSIDLTSTLKFSTLLLSFMHMRWGLLHGQTQDNNTKFSSNPNGRSYSYQDKTDLSRTIEHRFFVDQRFNQAKTLIPISVAFFMSINRRTVNKENGLFSFGKGWWMHSNDIHFASYSCYAV